MKYFAFVVFIICTTFIHTSAHALGNNKPQTLLELLAYADSAKHLIEEGAFDEALERLKWLDDNGTRISYRFYNFKRSSVYTTWWDLAQQYNRAGSAYESKLASTLKHLIIAPQQCETFDTSIWLSQTPEQEQHLLAQMTALNAQYNGSLRRCWNGEAEYLAIKYIHHDLLARYSQDILYGFIHNVIVKVTRAYEHCNFVEDKALCQSNIKTYLTETSRLYQAVAMDRDDLQLAGLIGGETLKLLLKWQNQPN
ncbi:hypothetical protein [Pseudoalteromonas aurantia]|uniref:Uncharacterized protein n=1 Tax=Pseudoalteromonas aurantia TaxID=43654 RepID=A0A5S3V7I1_9GAMM|nr:hypothetical protein [Pseudoalteromonas aurantia]TMO67513.1 hypothetical protein CWC19_13290 [Pseudoalteromonas aurantia]